MPTWVGAGYINGTAEAVFDLGLAWCQAPLGYAISLVIGGALFADKVRPTKAVTMLDPFQQYYGPWIAVLLCVPAVCGELLWTACNLSALGDTVSIISELNPTVAMVAAVGVILFYTSLGGIVSVIYTDVVQICTTGLGIWSCMAFLTRSKVVGKVGAPHNDWLGRTEEGDGSRMLDQFLMTILGGIPWQVQNITSNYDR
ncbi:high-affinity choline transporter 1-like [Haemaphysalis longicornis]